MNRRQFFQTTAAGAALMSLAARSATSAESGMERKPPFLDLERLDARNSNRSTGDKRVRRAQHNGVASSTVAPLERWRSTTAWSDRKTNMLKGKS